MDRPDEGPPAKTCRLSSPEPPRRNPPPPPPPPPPLLRLPLPPPQQRPRLREETEAAQVLADMRGVGLGPALPPPPPYVILEEGGVRAYFTLGAEGPGWDPAVESGFGEAPPPAGSLETLPLPEASGGSLEIDVEIAESSSAAEEKALETCSSGVWEPQMLVGPKRNEEAVIIVEDEDEDEQESVRRRRRRRRRKQRKVKKESRDRNAERMDSILQALESIQMDLEAVNIKAGKAFLRLKRKFIQMRRPFLERRDLIIQHIPGFWVKAFLNHPRISILINQRDEDIFRYLTNLQVQDLRHISMGYKMKLYFQTNPYFTNMVIVKEFQRNRSGRLVSHSTPIHWHRGQEPQAHKRKNQGTNYSFFSWFSNHSLPEADRIAEIIKNDLWVNPVRYFMREESIRTNRKKQEEKESKPKDEYEMVIMEDAYERCAVEDILSEISDIDQTTDNETIHDIKISDFMETTDYVETTDNEIADVSENLCDNQGPNSETTETADDNEGPDDNSENLEDSNKNTYDNENPDGDNSLEDGNQGSSGNNQNSESDSGDEGSEGDNEGSDDGNEGDNEGSDDDDRDIEYYKNGIVVFDKDQDNSTNQEIYEDDVEIVSEESMEEEEEGIEQGEDGSEEEESRVDSEDTDMEQVLQVPNAWANLGKRGNAG
ncbi:PREDICTED: testis-specific Y-encoded-like protein 2 [Chinchilla lanigera]|uniref:Testis-specific Y-encoded-like protein 2 n=1 Tax=Chinchilla lanigera TaxID=34839 RepID=A0A8C2US85_CHILA|nr:PREDICTED: testis-specific Y-encoded-like protein 2 [Chinchilla lanigera]